MMKKGDVINGYVLTTDAQNGGGQCEWAFATKDGEAFFIKRFLKPTYPLPDSPGSAATKAAKRARCDEFEGQQRQVIWKLREIAGEGGNLVVTRLFFREDAHYYKVTLKVDVTRMGPEAIADLPRDDRILIMLTAAKSLETLHRAGLVHGDVKFDNLLVRDLPGSGHAIKVIDFDNCFPVNHPGPADQLVGDLAFYSPELYLYHLGEGPGDVLDDKNDVFALGLVFWRYLAGERPALPPGNVYAAQTVLAGTSLTLPKPVRDRDVPVAEVVEAMLAKEASARPSMSEVHSSLKTARKAMPGGKPIRLVPRKPEVSTAKPGGLRGWPFRGRGAGSADAAAEGAGGGSLFKGKPWGLPGTAAGFAPARDGHEGLAAPGEPIIDAEPPLADAPPVDAPAADAGSERSRFRGSLRPRMPAGEDVPDHADAPKDAPDAHDEAAPSAPRLRGTLMRKRKDPPATADAAGAAPAEGADAPDGEDTTTEEPEADRKLSSRLLKRRE